MVKYVIFMCFLIIYVCQFNSSSNGTFLNSEIIGEFNFELNFMK